jgi:hypothetical protein
VTPKGDAPAAGRPASPALGPSAPRSCNLASSSAQNGREEID